MIATNEFHIAFYAATFLTCLTILFYTLLQRRTDLPQNRIFMVLVSILMINATTATICALAEPFRYQSQAAMIALETGQYLYFLLHTALSPTLYYYVLSVTGALRRRKKGILFLAAIPFFVTEAFVIVNPFMQHVYYYDEALNFHRNWAESLIYAAAALYFLLALGDLLFAWSAMTVRKRVSMVYFFSLAAIGVIIQLINIDIKAELFAESVGLVGLMLAVETEDERRDADTDIYNRLALKMDIEKLLAIREPISLIFVKIINSEMIERVTGSANSDLLSVAVSTYLKTLVPRYQIYHPNPETFVLFYLGNKESERLDIEQQIRERFESGWRIKNSGIMLDVVVIQTKLPGELKSAEDVFYVADSVIPQTVSRNDADIAYLMRRIEIERAIRRSLQNNRFEVYYQPTCYLDGPRLYGAEALVRMHDEAIGFVSPEEFIPVSEQVGLVEEIDDFVLREVCEFLESGIPQKYGLELINVNLSVIQCLRPGFFEHIVGIVNGYNIPHEMICFEITESVEAEDYGALSAVTRQLKSEGFSLAMDDYGTGYSNMEAIFKLDFDVVKIDKSILWSAEKDKAGRIILENSTRMIRALGKDIVVEGVESKEHIDLLAPLGVKYLQGYYFSKPVPKREFLEVIERL